MSIRSAHVLSVALLVVATAAISAGCRPGATVPSATPVASGTPGTGAAPAGVVTAPLEVASVRLPDHVDETLTNGAWLLLAEKHDVPMVAFSARMMGGALADPPGKAGVAAVLAEALRKGAGARSSAEFAEAVDAAGATISTSAAREAILVSGEFLAQDTALMVELLADLLRRPTLAADEVTKVRDRAIDAIAAAKDQDPSNLIGTYGDAFLFAGHPYGLPVGGDETSLAAVTPADVRAYYDAEFGADRLVLAVVGDFDAATLMDELKAALGDWPGATGAPPASVAPMPAASGRRVLLVDKPGSSQTYFWLGNVGAARRDTQKAAVDLVNTVFGGRFTSMLNNALRVESGLTYGAWSVLERLYAPGSFAVVSYTATESSKQAIDMAIDLLGTYRDDGMDAATLSSAKAYVLGQFPLEFETDAQIAARLAEIAFYVLEDDDVDGYGAAVAATSPDQIAKQIARVIPAPGDLAIVLIGDAASIRDLAAGYGPVTEMRITDPRFAPVP